MMRKFAIGAALLALLSTVAMGASITMLSQTVEGGGNNYSTMAISSGGEYVGTATDNGTWFVPTLYDTTAGTYNALSLKSGNSSVHGVEVMSDGTAVSMVQEQSNADTASYRVGIPGSNGYLYADDGNFGKVGLMNSMAMDANGNGWLVGEAEKSARLQGQAWQITGGVVNANAAWAKKIAGGKVKLQGMSVAGLAVGTDSKAGRAGSTDGPVIAQVAAGGTGWIINPWPGALDTKGQGHGISNNAVWATGYFNEGATVDPLHGFRNVVATNTTEELFPVGYDVAQYQLSFGADAANDGDVVGYTYNAIAGPEGYVQPGYRATIWFSSCSSGQGYMVEQILMDLGVDIYAEGFEYLERVTGISDDGTMVTGRAVRASDGAYVGYVAVIPEPATMSFLALGGLALLRRRR